jgi:glutamyl-tRNA synthetase
MPGYRGRIAPTPTGWLHAGHAATFWQAARRAEEAGGRLIFRMEDLDRTRCREEFAQAALEDLFWLGIRWQEGVEYQGCGGGNNGPYRQSERYNLYIKAWHLLRDGGWIYPSPESRKDVAAASQAPHEEEAIFPIAWRRSVEEAGGYAEPRGTNWRFRVPDGEVISFCDGRRGEFRAEAGRDFGDFVIWRRDDVPAYELAVVVDDAAMGITEVVRGEDLLLSTCRQLLVYRALGLKSPGFFHTELLRDGAGQRLAKRSASASIRQARESGRSAPDFWQAWGLAGAKG